MAIIQKHHNGGDIDRWNAYFRSPWAHAEEDLTGCWCPSVDIYEDENAIILTAELPGMKKKEVKIEVQDNILTISGDRGLDREDKRANYHRVERCYGSFSRSFSLGQSVDQGGIEAEMNKGILTVTLPKREETKPKEIAVSVK